MLTNWNNIYSHSGTELFSLFAFVSILHEVIIENKVGQFVFAIRKRIGIMGIICSRIGIIFIRIRGQNYFHYSHSFQNNHNKFVFFHYFISLKINWYNSCLLYGNELE